MKSGTLARKFHRQHDEALGIGIFFRDQPKGSSSLSCLAIF
jgi:hypothetical protein